MSGEWGARAIDGDDLMTSAFGAVIPYACSIATGSLSTEAPAS